VLSALAKAFADLGDARVRSVLWASILLTLLVFVAIGFGAYSLLTGTVMFERAWAEAIADVAAGLAVLLVSFLLFTSVLFAIAGILTDKVAARVEQLHYPGLPPARAQSIGEIIGNTLQLLGAGLLLNLIALPLYFVPGLNAITFYTVNGLLLGREFFETAALRRLTPFQAKQTRRANRLRILAAGIVIAFIATVPVLNLTLPVLATAFMVHVFHGLKISSSDRNSA
jgi:uncharacterized protein involved in cysteine biosynthesis